jgi:hypothetical protein
MQFGACRGNSVLHILALLRRAVLAPAGHESHD